MARIHVFCDPRARGMLMHSGRESPTIRLGGTVDMTRSPLFGADGLDSRVSMVRPGTP